MKTLEWIVGLIALLIIGFFVLNSYMYSAKQSDSPMRTANVTVIPISHATGIITWDEATLYTDPTGGSSAFVGQKPADIVLVTDIHSDHFSTSTLAAVVGTSTTLIVPQAVKDQLPEELAAKARVLANGQSITALDFAIEAIPMYNVPESAESFHTKGRGNGYLIERDGFRVYIAGDTSGTPEMRALQNIDIALIPMNLPYTMSVEEAADAVLAFKPKVAYPYHYRGQSGLSDVSHFKDLVNAGDPSIEVGLLDWYPME